MGSPKPLGGRLVLRLRRPATIDSYSTACIRPALFPRRVCLCFGFDSPRARYASTQPIPVASATFQRSGSRRRNSRKRPPIFGRSSMICFRRSSSRTHKKPRQASAATGAMTHARSANRLGGGPRRRRPLRTAVSNARTNEGWKSRGVAFWNPCPVSWNERL